MDITIHAYKNIVTSKEKLKKKKNENNFEPPLANLFIFGRLYSINRKREIYIYIK